MWENSSAPMCSPFDIIRQTQNTISVWSDRRAVPLTQESLVATGRPSPVDPGGFGEGGLGPHTVTSGLSNAPALGQWVPQGVMETDSRRR